MYCLSSHSVVWLRIGSGARNCNTISVRVRGHPLGFILWPHCKISGLVFCVWELESLIVACQKFLFEEKCKAAPIDRHVGPLLDFYLQIFFDPKEKILLSLLMVMWPSSTKKKLVMLRSTRESPQHLDWTMPPPRARTARRRAATGPGRSVSGVWAATSSSSSLSFTGSTRQVRLQPLLVKLVRQLCSHNWWAPWQHNSDLVHHVHAVDHQSLGWDECVQSSSPWTFSPPPLHSWRRSLS